MASPARHREGAGKIHLPAVQGWGAAHEDDGCSFNRSSSWLQGTKSGEVEFGSDMKIASIV